MGDVPPNSLTVFCGRGEQSLRKAVGLLVLGLTGSPSEGASALTRR